MKNKNLLSGAYGRVKDKGGSRYYTTPKTVLVPPDYEIDTGVEGDFVTCTLDGRLWVFGNNLIALKWNKNAVWENDIERKGKMELADTKQLDEDEEVIASGIDWIVTNKSIIQAIDNSPYIFIRKIEDIEYAFGNLQYSFSSNNFKTVQDFISILPKINNYQLIGGFLIPCFNIQEHEAVSLSPVKLEYMYYYFDEGKGYDDIFCQSFNIEFLMFSLNGLLWGISRRHIGKVYLIPQTFYIHNNDVLQYYLYLASDFLTPYKILNDKWDSIRLCYLALISLDNNYPYLFKLGNYNRFCLNSSDNKIYDLQNKTEYELVKEDNTFTIDTLTYKGFFSTNDNNGKICSINVFGENLFIENKFNSNIGLLEWVNPADKNITNISNNNLIFPLNNNGDIIITHLKSNLYREILQKNKLPLTCCTYGEQRKQQLSLGLKNIDNSNIITVNGLDAPDFTPITPLWDDIYKKPFEIKNISSIQKQGEIFRRGSLWRVTLDGWVMNLAYGFTYIQFIVEYYDARTNTWHSSTHTYDLEDDAKAYWAAHTVEVPLPLGQIAYEHDCYNGIRLALHGNTIGYEVFNLNDETIRFLSGASIPQETIDLNKDLNESELTPRLRINNVSDYSDKDGQSTDFFSVNFYDEKTTLDFTILFKKSYLNVSEFLSSSYLSKQDENNQYLTHHTVQIQTDENYFTEIAFDTELISFFDEDLQKFEQLEEEYRDNNY